MSRLPENWHSLGALWEGLNDPRRRPTPQVVIEAIMYVVRQRGLGALKDPETKERLSRYDRAARNEINRRIAAMLEKGIIRNEPAA